MSTRVVAFKLEDTTVEYYTDGCLKVRNNSLGTIEKTYQPSEPTSRSKGGRAQKEQEISDLMEAFGVDDNPIDRTLCKGAVSQSTGWLAALLKLVERHKEGGASIEITGDKNGEITIENGEFKGRYHDATSLTHTQARAFIRRALERQMDDDAPSVAINEDFSFSK